MGHFSAPLDSKTVQKNSLYSIFNPYPPILSWLHFYHPSHLPSPQNILSQAHQLLTCKLPVGHSHLICPSGYFSPVDHVFLGHFPPWFPGPSFPGLPSILLAAPSWYLFPAPLHLPDPQINWSLWCSVLQLIFSIFPTAFWVGSHEFK